MNTKNKGAGFLSAPFRFFICICFFRIAIVFGLRQGVFSKELFAKRGKVRIFGVNTRIKSVMPFLSEEIW